MEKWFNSRWYFRMNKKNQYTLQIMNQLEGRLSQREEKELSSWLEEDPKHREEYALIAKIVQEGRKKEFPGDPDVLEQWEKFVFPSEPAPGRNPLLAGFLSSCKQIGSILHPPRLAFAVLILCIIGASASWYHHSIHSLNTILTANRQHSHIQLPDGSTVYLNSGTELSYPKKFHGNARQVTLQGEAFFDVTQSGSPFVVKTSEGNITVLGTRFNIWAREKRTRVIVEEGRVRLTANAMDSSVVLFKNELSEIIQNHAPTQPVAAASEELPGWRSGKLVFTRTMLSELVGEIGRYYDVRISIHNPKLKTKTLTAHFDRLPLQQVLYAICTTLEIRYQYENGSYVLYSEKKQDDQ